MKHKYTRLPIFIDVTTFFNILHFVSGQKLTILKLSALKQIDIYF